MGSKCVEGREGRRIGKTRKSSCKGVSTEESDKATRNSED